jgi:hypothetical protein
MVKNTISAYREFRKRDKAIIEFATRARDPEIEKVLVQCLNDCQVTVRIAQEDPNNQELMEKLADHMKTVKHQQQILAHAVPDRNDLGEVKTVTGKRQRKAVDRYRDSDYDSDTGARKLDKRKMESSAEEEDYDGDYDENAHGDSDEDDGDSINDDYDLDDGGEDREDLEWQPPLSDDDDDVFSALLSGDDEAPEEGTEASMMKRKEMRAARIEMRNECQDDEGLRRLKRILTTDPGRVYAVADLENPTTLKRALELAYCARSGVDYDTPTSIHIDVSDHNLVFWSYMPNNDIVHTHSRFIATVNRCEGQSREQSSYRTI